MIVNEEAVKKILEEVKPAKLVAATKYVDVKEIEKLEKLGYKWRNLQKFCIKNREENVIIYWNTSTK